MVRHLVTSNEYRLPERFDPGTIVVDIGVHIGGFSYSALTQGASRVYGFEAEPSNYACARRNLAPFADRLRLVNRAVWRSDQGTGRLLFTLSDDPGNTGGGTLLWETDGPRVEAVPFDDVLEAISEGGRRRIHLLKIDCEGSEFPILLTARLLGRIDRIVGEFHEIPAPLPAHVRVPGYERFTIGALIAALERAGFAVAWERHGASPLGLFFADRRPAPRPGARLRAMWRHLSQSTPHVGRRAGATTERITR